MRKAVYILEETLNHFLQSNGMKLKTENIIIEELHVQLTDVQHDNTCIFCF